MSSEKVCSVKGCNRFTTMEDYCYMHYAQLIQDKDNPRRQPKVCSAEGCSKPPCNKRLL